MTGSYIYHICTDLFRFLWKDRCLPSVGSSFLKLITTVLLMQASNIMYDVEKFMHIFVLIVFKVLPCSTTVFSMVSGLQKERVAIMKLCND